MAGPIRTVTMIVKKIEDLGDGTKRLNLVDEDDWPLPPFLPGAHIDVHLPNRHVRTYSLCNDPADNRNYVIAVKREPGGRGGSAYIHDKLKIGDVLGVSLPRGGQEMTDAPIHVYIAGGIGVTPFLSAVQSLERQGRTDYVMHWISVGTPALLDMVPASALEQRIVLHDTALNGIPDIKELIGRYDSAAHLSCCGPLGMLDAFEQAVQDRPAHRIHVERFVPPKRPVDPHTKPFQLVLAKSGKEMVVEPGMGLQAALESLDVDVSVSCGGGICGACRVKWLEGPPVHNDRVLTPAERAHDVMVCVAGCAGPRLVLDL